MAYSKLRGFSAYRKDLTVTVETTVKTTIPVLDKKGKPVIENGRPKTIVKETIVKKNDFCPFIIRCNNAVPPSHKMLH